MVEYQLRRRGIFDPRVLEAMLEIPREVFVAEQFRRNAYADTPLGIGSGQTISQPYTVAFMCQSLELAGTETVLEIGTGSGYGAAVLSKLAAEVHTIERVPELVNLAKSHLQQIACRNVTVHLGDGSVGLPDCAPFDAIVSTAGGKELPMLLIDQLVDGGKILIPLGSQRTSQSMMLYRRVGEHLESRDLGRFAFVPLIGQLGWHEEDW